MKKQWRQHRTDGALVMLCFFLEIKLVMSLSLRFLSSPNDLRLSSMRTKGSKLDQKP